MTSPRRLKMCFPNNRLTSLIAQKSGNENNIKNQNTVILLAENENTPVNLVRRAIVEQISNIVLISAILAIFDLFRYKN